MPEIKQSRFALKLKDRFNYLAEPELDEAGHDDTRNAGSVYEKCMVEHEESLQPNSGVSSWSQTKEE